VNRVVTLGPDNTSEEVVVAVLEDIYDEADNEMVCLRLIFPENSQGIGAQFGISDLNFTITDRDDCRKYYIACCHMICFFHSQHS